MKTIYVLGPGCPKCGQLYDNVKQAAEEMKLDCTIEKVSDLSKIMAFGVMTTPALVVDGKVVMVGRVPDTSAIKVMLG